MKVPCSVFGFLYLLLLLVLLQLKTVPGVSIPKTQRSFSSLKILLLNVEVIGQPDCWRYITCKRAGLAFIRGFADMHLSLQCLLPVTPVEVGRITTHIVVGIDLCLAELKGSQPGILCDILVSIFFPILSLPLL